MTTPDSRPPFRLQWLPLVGIFALIAFLGALGMQILGQQGSAQTTNGLIPTVGPLTTVTVARIGVSISAPEIWKAPVILDDQRFVISASGSPDTSSTAGPFLYVINNAQSLFSTLNIRTDLSDPVAQLDLVIGALNRDRLRLDEAAPYRGTKYPAAVTRGVERGNQIMIVLFRTPDGRWVYLGAQAPTDRFDFYESTVFAPAAASLTVLN